jgi:SNF2 family DNA or RNA helicase
MITVAETPKDSPYVGLSTDDSTGDAAAWARLQVAYRGRVLSGGDSSLVVPIDVFLGQLPQLQEIRRLYGTEFEFDDGVRRRLRALGQARRSRIAIVTSADSPSLSEDVRHLLDRHLRRPLTSFQVSNLAKIMALPHAADFSVPGAGKTSVALANYLAHREAGVVNRALIVAPLSAFSAWPDEAEACLKAPPTFSFHTVGERIPVATEMLLTNYHRLANDYDHLREWVAANDVHVILDEAHRIKRGRSGVHGEAALNLAFSAVRRDILTGTPAPQGAHDLVALIDYLYPGQARQILPAGCFNPRRGLEEAVLQDCHATIDRLFVRTTKSQMNLPPASFDLVEVEMGPVQKAIYEAITGRYAGILKIDQADRLSLARMSRIVMYLLEAATNPALLTAGSDESDLDSIAHPPIPEQIAETIGDLLEQYQRYEVPSKYLKVEEIVAESASNGEKVLVWSSFVRNIKLLKERLSRFSPAVIHGGIPTSRDPVRPDPESREAELLRFREEATCTVLLANPAAAAEGISLHQDCHHAVYLDRTFNAGHYLQSQDRIHRLGLPPDTVTRFTTLLSPNTIDEVVDERLRTKIAALAVLMNDPGLVALSLPASDDPDAPNDPTESADLRAVSSHLGLG